MFEDSVLIVAHPDDDILWLSSVIDKVEKIIFCFNEDPAKPALGVARKKTIAEYPLSNVSTLDIAEPQSFDKADWSEPVTTEYGLKLSRCKESDARYKKTYEELVHRVRNLVADRKNVFTHNPWGEYGHEDHVLVYQVLKTLQVEFHYTLWFSNYCSNRSVTLMDNYISGFHSDYECLPANRVLAQQIADVFKTNGCWTWYEDYQWFDSECLMRSTLSEDHPAPLPYGHNFPINYIKIHIKSEKPQPHPLIKMWKKIKRKLLKAI